MMDITTVRAPPPARAESHLSKGSRELARPGPSLYMGVPLFFLSRSESVFIIWGLGPRLGHVDRSEGGAHLHLRRRDA